MFRKMYECYALFTYLYVAHYFACRESTTYMYNFDMLA